MADRQQGIAGDTPHRWLQIHAWRQDGSSRLLYYGRVDTKESMREMQERYKVRDRCVWCDAAFEKHEVFKECAEYGWLAAFGSDQGQWRHDLPNPIRSQPPLKIFLPFSPWQRTAVAQKIVNYLYFSEDFCADILANLYAGRGVRYEIPEDVGSAFLEQMKGEHKIMRRGKMTWEKIHSGKANHAFDTGKMGICFALLMRLLAMPRPVGPGGVDKNTPEPVHSTTVG